MAKGGKHIVNLILILVMSNISHRVKLKILKLIRKGCRRYSINSLKKNKGLWDELIKYQDLSESTGCSWTDLYTLYKTVRKKKPQEILEPGPGVSTLVMSYAIYENEKEGFKGHITAMEELDKYLKIAKQLHPKFLSKYVTFHKSPRIEDNYHLFKGVRYKDVPEKQYDFIFIDGPHHHSPIDDSFLFDFDFIHILQKSNKPIYGIVDYRLTTSFALQSLLGLNKVKFNSLLELCFIRPCTKSDLFEFNLENMTQSFNRNSKLLGNTKIGLK